MIKYLSRRHVYKDFDCITLVREFYQNELGISFNIPDYSSSRFWIKQFTVETIDNHISKYGKKVTLTDAKNYDLLVFRSESNLITHFAIYLAPNKMLHVEENSLSTIDILDSYWINNLFAVYRHNDLVQ